MLYPFTSSRRYFLARWASVASYSLAILLLTACMGRAGDGYASGSTGPTEPRENFPQVAIPCPPGFTAHQCVIMYDAIANLMAHGRLECQWAGAEFGRQMNEGKVDWGNNEDPGEELTTGASWRFSNGTWDDRTTLFDNAFLWEGQVEGVIAHEVYGHQTLGDTGEGHPMGIYYEALCSGSA